MLKNPKRAQSYSNFLNALKSTLCDICFSKPSPSTNPASLPTPSPFTSSSSNLTQPTPTPSTFSPSPTFSRPAPPLALPYIQKAIALRPDIADLYNTLGRALQAVGKEADAIQAWRKSISLNPRLFESLLNLGKCLCDAGEYEEAIKINNRAVEVNPRSVASFNNLGNALRAQGRIDDAIAAYRRAIVAGGISVTQVRTDHLPNSVAGEFAVVCFNLGECHQTISSFQDAAKWYRMALQADQKMLLAHVRLAAALAQLQLFDAAIQSWRDAAALAPDSPLTHEALGLIQYHQQDPRQAELSFRRGPGRSQ